MTAGAAPITPSHTTGRDFLAPAVERAVASLRLPAGGWVLDAGAGSGSALPALARAVGAAGSVLAVDVDPAVLPLATAHAALHGMAPRCTVQYADLVDVVERSATEAGGGFDAIWACDVVEPGTFADPAAAVRAMARALRPGGVLALFHSDHQQAVFLPGHARLERLLRAAAELHRGGDGDHDQHLSWLQAAGLEQLGLDVFPRIALRVDADRGARAHLEHTVWPQMWAAALACGPRVGMTEADVAELQALTTRGGSRYVLDDPGFYVLHPTILATGRRGRSGRR